MCLQKSFERTVNKEDATINNEECIYVLFATTLAIPIFAMAMLLELSEFMMVPQKELTALIKVVSCEIIWKKM